jgi:hypothetical protein
MIVNHWTLLDYAYCHYIKKTPNYSTYIKVVDEANKKGLPLTLEEILGLFYGIHEPPEHEMVIRFMKGEFKPTSASYASKYVRKSKPNQYNPKIIKQIVGDVLRKLRIVRKVNGNVQIPLDYFELLIESYNELTEAVITYRKTVGENPNQEEIGDKLKRSVEVLVKGGLYK